jgi:hypothetical protein
MSEETKATICSFFSLIAPEKSDDRSTGKFKWALKIPTGSATYIERCFERSDALRAYPAACIHLAALAMEKVFLPFSLPSFLSCHPLPFSFLSLHPAHYFCSPTIERLTMPLYFCN